MLWPVITDSSPSRRAIVCIPPAGSGESSWPLPLGEGVGREQVTLRIIGNGRKDRSCFASDWITGFRPSPAASIVVGH